MRSMLVMGLLLVAFAAPTARATEVWTETFEGTGQTEPKARLKANEEAYEKVIRELRHRLPHLEWTPTLEWLMAYLSRWEMSKPTEVTVSGGVGAALKVQVTVAISQQDLEEIAREDVRYREETGRSELQKLTRERRPATWGKILGGMVGLLLIGAGYYRLEEMTKGYYTTRLRVVAIAGSVLVSAVVLALLVIG